MDELEYETGGASLETLAELSREIWADLKGPVGRTELGAAGFPSDAPDADIAFKFEPKQSSMVGLPETIAISILASHALSQVGTRVALDIWKTVILPRIKLRYGADALGDERVSARTRAKTSETKSKKKKGAKGKTAKDSKDSEKTGK